MPVNVAAQIETWRTQLLDTSKRNRLINFKTGRGGGIALLHPDPGELWHQLVADNTALTFPWKRELLDLPEEPEESETGPAGMLTVLDPDTTPGRVHQPANGQNLLDRCRCSPRLRPEYLLTELPDKQLATRLNRLHLSAREALTERGITILYVAFGFLRWYDSVDSQVEIRSPLLLVPVRLERDSVEAPWELQGEDEEILPNHSLAQLMSSAFKLRLPAIEEVEIDTHEPAWRTGYFAAVQHCIRDQPRWEVLDEVALGTFNFQKLAMWEDLGRNQDHIQNHDLCRAIAGDSSVVFRSPADVPAAEELDEKVPPHQTHLILDADSSQHAAIVTALRGADLVLDGPPGTGKSQTIANLIAEFLAAGKTVLFVSEKAAALEVVKRRLDGRGLGDFCLALHSHKANKKEVVEELGRCLSLTPDSHQDSSDDLDQLSQTRRRLNEYVRELRRVCPPLGLSAFKVHGELARLARLTSTSRCPIPQILQRDAAYLHRLTELLAQLPDCRSVIELRDRHPWRGCRAGVYSLTLNEDVRHHFGRLASCLRQAAEAAPLLAEVGLEVADLTRAGWLTALAQARGILACPLVPADWFERDARRLAEAVIQLDLVTGKYRQVREMLPEFSANALGRVDLASLIGTLAQSGRHARLRPRAGDSVRTRRERLTRAGTDLHELFRRAVAAEQAEQAVPGLLRVPIPSQSVRALGRFVELAAHIASMRPVRRSWWDPAKRRELQSVAARCREEARAAQEMRSELVSRFSPQAFAAESAILVVQASRRPSRAPQQTATTLADERQRLARLGGDLRELHRRTTMLDQAAQQALDLLQVSSGPLRVESLGRLAEWADQVARMKPVPRSWWEPARRQEVQIAIARCQEEARAAQESRIELMARLSVQAFAPEGALLAAQAGRFRSFLVRLLPRWWFFKSRVSGWYTNKVPRAAALLDDLGRLAAYHRRADYCRQVQAHYAADLLANGEGQPDWDGTLEGLQSVDRLEQFIKAPSALQRALSPDGYRDGLALLAATASLAQHVKSFQELLDTVERVHSLSATTPGTPRDVQVTTRDLAAWLEAQIATVDEETAVLDGLCGLLGEGQDTSARAALLDDLGRLTAYHRRADYCRQVQAQYATDLLADGEGQPDWDGTLEGLRSVDRLEQFTKIPAALQALLTTEGPLDHAALAAAASALSRQVAFLREQSEVAGQNYDLSEVADGESHRVRLSAHDFAAWLEAQIADIEAEAALIDWLCELLEAGRDLNTDAVPDRLRALAELAGLREEVMRLRDRIWPAEAPEAVEDRDWSALRAHAEGLIRFLNEWGRPVPPPVIRALTAPEARARLEEAVRRNDAARSQGFDESWQFLASLFDPCQEVSTGVVIDRALLADLHSWLAARADDAHRIHEWTQFCEIQREVAQAGVLPILTEVFEGQVQLGEAGDAFRARFFRLWLDALYEQAPALRQFSTESHERLTDKFRALDRRSVESAAARVRHILLSRPDRPRAISAEAPGSSELGTLLREVHKKRRHLPLRKLFAAVPTLLPRLKPCLMMSPLAVSTYLQSPDFRFDLVIFDEASQVRPHDAICAIYRGRQLLVAGDQKQLPPTSFFERSLDADDGLPDEDEDDGTRLDDFESVLDVCCTLGLARRRLRWHYRSRREPLIAFSNHHFYANELVTFPSVHDTDGNPAVAFEYVVEGRWKAGSSGGFNAVEAARTAERVLEHFRECPEQSLGVIAFSQRQQLRILDELERLRRASPELEEFFREDRGEPFFVKNLENVQGDERDIIFLSVGYGPDETGRVAMRFGPLNREGGERRLNVAVTRARRGMRVVSSLRAQDIDLSRTAAVGVRLLRAYLDFAEQGPAALRGAITEDSARDFDSPFEREVFDELTRRGLAVHPQVGCSGFRIDLAVMDPRAPGRYLLGVECDGATYHSSATARDRDRLRQEVLESLGWRICRIWSTDWLRDRDGQVRRVLAALEKAQQEEPALTSTPRSSALKGPGSPARAARSEGPDLEVAPPDYASIDEVPDGALRDAVLETLRSYGATEAGDLVQAVARRLGFKRTGKRIQARIGETIEDLLRAGQVCRASDQRLQYAQPSQAVNM